MAVSLKNDFEVMPRRVGWLINCAPHSLLQWTVVALYKFPAIGVVDRNWLNSSKWLEFPRECGHAVDGVIALWLSGLCRDGFVVLDYHDWLTLEAHYPGHRNHRAVTPLLHCWFLNTR